MPRQNRVTPWGRIIAAPARGRLLGNRGVLHDAQGRIVRPWRVKAWIACRLAFKGRRRVLMQPDRWTELFFLDEATALAAGHRPCFECRREAARRFKAAWLAGNPGRGLGPDCSIARIDECLHAERIARDGAKVTWTARLAELPEGAMVALGREPHLLSGGRLYPWRPDGYGPPIAAPDREATVLTPRSIVNAIAAGYPLSSSAGEGWRGEAAPG